MNDFPCGKTPNQNRNPQNPDLRAISPNEPHYPSGHYFYGMETTQSITDSAPQPQCTAVVINETPEIVNIDGLWFIVNHIEVK